MAKNFVVFLGRDVTPGKASDDRAVRKRKLNFLVGLDRDVVAENGANIIKVAFFVRHGDNGQSRYPEGSLPREIGEFSSSTPRAEKVIAPPTPTNMV